MRVPLRAPLCVRMCSLAVHVNCACCCYLKKTARTHTHPSFTYQPPQTTRHAVRYNTSDCRCSFICVMVGANDPQHSNFSYTAPSVSRTTHSFAIGSKLPHSLNLRSMPPYSSTHCRLRGGSPRRRLFVCRHARAYHRAMCTTTPRGFRFKCCRER